MKYLHEEKPSFNYTLIETDIFTLAENGAPEVHTILHYVTTKDLDTDQDYNVKSRPRSSFLGRYAQQSRKLVST